MNRIPASDFREKNSFSVFLFLAPVTVFSSFSISPFDPHISSDAISLSVAGSFPSLSLHLPLLLSTGLSSSIRSNRLLLLHFLCIYLIHITSDNSQILHSHFHFSYTRRCDSIQQWNCHPAIAIWTDNVSICRIFDAERFFVFASSNEHLKRACLMLSIIPLRYDSVHLVLSVAFGLCINIYHISYILHIQHTFANVQEVCLPLILFPFLFRSTCFFSVFF